MHKFYLTFVLLITCLSMIAQDNPLKSAASSTLDEWHKAASNADFDSYFSIMTDDAVFIGTDATENWQLDEFKAFSKPYFDKGKAWSFTSLKRNLYVAGGIVYFDELLDTQMGICRGSGVLKSENGVWKIAHYVLSIAVPNDNVASLTALKSDWDREHILFLNMK